MLIKPLSQLEPTESGRIIRVGGGGEIRRRLLDMGVVAGATVEVQRLAPFGDPVQIRVKGYDLALRKEEAEKIQVELTGGFLSRTAPGENVIITTIRAGWGLQRRLAGLGIGPGMPVKVISSGRPGPIIIEVGGSQLSLGNGVASKIMVRAKE